MYRMLTWPLVTLLAVLVSQASASPNNDSTHVSRGGAKTSQELMDIHAIIMSTWRRSFNAANLTGNKIALLFVGGARGMWLPFMVAGLANYPLTESDVFLNMFFADSHPEMWGSHWQGSAFLKGVKSCLTALRPVHLHLIEESSCENASAKAELPCCDETKIANAMVQSAVLNKVTPFTMKGHAHGQLQYYHLRQGYRDIVAYEATHAHIYEWIVRVRPDLYLVAPMKATVILTLPKQVHGAPKEVSGDMLADWMFAVPHELAGWFFEQSLLECLRPAEAGGWGHLSRTDVQASCINGPIYHAPEYLLTPWLRRSGHFIELLPLFPLARVIKTAPGYIARMPNNTKDEYAKGIYTIACNERWPPDMQHALLRCKRIGAALKM